MSPTKWGHSEEWNINIPSYETEPNGWDINDFDMTLKLIYGHDTRLL